MARQRNGHSELVFEEKLSNYGSGSKSDVTRFGHIDFSKYVFNKSKFSMKNNA